MATTLHTSDLDLPLLHRGKVRDVYGLPGNRLLMVASDRLSAFDVVLPDPIPGKGEMLCQISNFWFGKTAHLCPNHLTHEPVASVLPAGVQAALYTKRSVVAKKLKALPVEAIARGYIIGSGWKDYQANGAICGIRLPTGLRQAEQLPEPIFTPSTKAAVGDHDENVGFDVVVDKIGAELAEQIRAKTLEIYAFAARYARERGIIIADTKLEFGLDENGVLHVMDEMLTPDSSRFWPADSYTPGRGQPSFDKQPLRDWLDVERRAGRWNGESPPPTLPDDVIRATSRRYRDAFTRLTGAPLDLARLGLPEDSV